MKLTKDLIAAPMPPKSGSEMFQQRLVALHTSQIYTQLSSEIYQPTYKDWLYILEQEAILIQNQLAQSSRSDLTPQPSSTRLSVLLGDSLTQWFPSKLLPSKRFWLNQGISGDTTGGILKRLFTFSQTQPDAIYILAGINDLKNQITPKIILDNHQQIIQILQQNHPETTILVQSIFPTSLPTKFLPFNIPNSQIQDLNQQLAQVVRKSGATYLDFHDRFTNSQGNLRSDLTTDGLHLNLNGYKLWQFALHQTESRLIQKRDETYQKWLRTNSQFTLNGKSYTWVPYRIQPGDTLQQITLKTLGQEGFDYWDIIAIRNNLTSELLFVDQMIEVPQNQ